MCLFLSSPHALAYSILAHEAIIDSTWDKIRGLLLERFPSATPEELLQAKSYAHGGCLIQDLGYYPHGSRFYSDLTHYVRSGDFIEALLRDAQDLDEYAFALGALAHYAADTNGHEAVNRAVPLLYPKLARKHGNIVTYEDDPVAHLKTEFGFDVLQVAKAGMPPMLTMILLVSRLPILYFNELSWIRIVSRLDWYSTIWTELSVRIDTQYVQSCPER
jgi:hypothetical protein